MKDIHSHLIYGVDDGSKSLEESIELLKKMEKAGTTDLMLTPHYVENSNFICNNKNKNAIFKKLKDKAKKENININLYLGNEVFFTENFLKLIKSGEIRTLNNSKYLLFEFPMNHLYPNTGDVISLIISKGCVPVLAHPERYLKFIKHPDIAEEYLRMGVLLQGNFTSLFNKYGRESKKLLTYYLKKHWITFLGSDTHNDIKRYNEKKLRRKLLRITKDKDYVDDLLYNNFDKVINNEEIGILR